MPPPRHTQADGSIWVTLGFAFAGLILYSVVNVVVVFQVFFSAANTSGSGVTPVALGALALAVTGLVAGGALLLVRKPWARGLGVGLMSGWALWTIMTAGLCTGVNPSFYGAA